MAVSTIKTDNRANLGTAISLASYTSQDYVVPSDGYVVANCGSASNSKAIARVYAKDNTNNINVGGWGNGTYGVWSVFVRRGMRVRVITLENNGYVTFVPLTD